MLIERYYITACLRRKETYGAIIKLILEIIIY